MDLGQVFETAVVRTSTLVVHSLESPTLPPPPIDAADTTMSDTARDLNASQVHAPVHHENMVSRVFLLR